MDYEEIIELFNPNNGESSILLNPKKVVGRGAFSEVFEAIAVGDTSDCRCHEKKGEVIEHNKVAVKISQSSDDITREAEILERLSHPYVVKLLCRLTNQKEGKDVTSGLVMERLEGPDLFQLVINDGSVSEARAASYALCILSALRYLGQSRVTHGDVNLYNIVLSGSSHGVKLVDFGCARIYESHDKEGLREGIFFDLECFGSSLFELMTSQTFETSRDHRSWSEMAKKSLLSPQDLQYLERNSQLFQPDFTGLSPAAVDFIRRLRLPRGGRQSDKRRADRGQPSVDVTTIEDIYVTFIGHMFLERSDNPRYI